MHPPQAGRQRPCQSAGARAGLPSIMPAYTLSVESASRTRPDKVCAARNTGKHLLADRRGPLIHGEPQLRSIVCLHRQRVARTRRLGQCSLRDCASSCSWFHPRHPRGRHLMRPRQRHRMLPILKDRFTWRSGKPTGLVRHSAMATPKCAYLPWRGFSRCSIWTMTR